MVSVMAEHIRKVWFRFLSSGKSHGKGTAAEENVYYLNAFHLVGITSTVIFSILNFSAGHFYLGSIELTAALLATGNLLLFWKTCDYQFTVSVALGIMFFLLLVLLYTGGIEGTGVFWFFTFPILAFFLAGKQAGFKWMLALFSAILLILLAKLTGVIKITQSAVEIRQLIASLAAVTVMTYLYEWTVARYKRLMKERNAQLERAIAAEKHFLASISHEIRTPLNSILGFSDLLTQTSLDHAQKEYLDEVLNSSSHLKELVNDIMDVSKLEAGQLDLTLKETNLAQIIRDAATTARLRLHETVKLEVDIPDLPYKLMADSVRIRQIFLKLLGNAAKFTKQGAIQLSVKEIHEEAGKVHIAFVIKDTGIGIPKHKQNELFQPFKKIDNHNAPGTGLGLYLARSLACMQGGNIYLDASCEGVGTCFIVEFKLEKAADNSQKQPSHLQLEPLRADYSSLRILVVEDIDLNIKVVREILRHYFNASIEVAKNGLQAVEKMAENDFDLVLMDIQMPVMNGFQATRRIRMTDKITPIFAMSANAMAEDAKKAAAIGMDGYITKPVHREELWEALHYASLRASGSEAEAPATEIGIITNQKVVMDRKKMHAYFMSQFGDEDLADDLVNTAVQNLQEYIETTEEALANRKMKEVERGFHSLKGILLGSNMEKMAQVASSLVERVRAGEAPESLEPEKVQLFQGIRSVIDG